MNIHGYYQLIREQEQAIQSEYVWVTSLSSRNGGVEGRVSEVARKTAARVIVDGAARLATPEEADEEQARLQAKHRRANASLCTSFIVASSGDQGERRR